MTIDLALSTGQLILWMLYICRTTGLIMIAPVLGGRNINVRIKVALVLMVSTMLFLVRSGELAAATVEFSPFLVILAARELLLGLFIGLLLKLMFVPVLLAGDLIAHEMAFTMANVVDPDSGRGMSVIAVLFDLLALMIFLAFDMHHKVLEMLALSFEARPPLEATLPNWIGWFFQYFVSILQGAIVLVAPVFLLLLVLTLAVGLMSKTVPQMNALDFSFPTRILGAMLSLFAFWPEMAARIHQILAENTDTVFAYLRTW